LFISVIGSNDIIFLSECWLDVNTDFDDKLIKEKYYHRCFPRKSCKGGGLTIIYKKELHEFLSVEKNVNESLLWLKLHNGISADNDDIYIGFVYLPLENNVFYRNNDIDFFSVFLLMIHLCIQKEVV
jgi:hypothetical protein